MIGILSSLLNGLCSICTSLVLFTYKIVLTSTLTDYVEPILLHAHPLLPTPQGTIAFLAGALITSMFIADHILQYYLPSTLLSKLLLITYVWSLS